MSTADNREPAVGCGAADSASGVVAGIARPGLEDGAATSGRSASAVGTAARLGVAASEIWFVGDRLDTDVAGAKASGMTAVWFNPEGLQDPDQHADLTVASWDELVRHATTST